MNKILIVDDEEAIRVLYDCELSEEGYKVFTLGDGSRVLEVIEQKKPDLILLDIKLGKLSGLDLLQEIRNTGHNMPVILCTAYSVFKYDMRAFAADDYLVKRSNLKELKERIKTALKCTYEFSSQAEPDELLGINTVY